MNIPDVGYYVAFVDYSVALELCHLRDVANLEISEVLHFGNEEAKRMRSNRRKKIDCLRRAMRKNYDCIT